MMLSSFHPHFILMALAFCLSNKKAGHTDGDSFGSPAVFFKTRCFPHPYFYAKGRLYRE
jgi:hypothetical protein